MDMDYPSVNLIGYTVLQYYFFGPIVGDDYFNNRKIYGRKTMTLNIV